MEKKGHIFFIIIGILVFIFLGVTYFFKSNINQPKIEQIGNKEVASPEEKENNQDLKGTINSKVDSDFIEEIDNEVSKWMVYKNEKYGFLFKYPKYLIEPVAPSMEGLITSEKLVCEEKISEEGNQLSLPQENKLIVLVFEKTSDYKLNVYNAGWQFTFDEVNEKWLMGKDSLPENFSGPTKIDNKLNVYLYKYGDMNCMIDVIVLFSPDNSYVVELRNTYCRSDKYRRVIDYKAIVSSFSFVGKRENKGNDSIKKKLERYCISSNKLELSNYYAFNYKKIDDGLVGICKFAGITGQNELFFVLENGDELKEIFKYKNSNLGEYASEVFNSNSLADGVKSPFKSIKILDMDSDTKNEIAFYSSDAGGSNSGATNMIYLLDPNSNELYHIFRYTYGDDESSTIKDFYSKNLEAISKKKIKDYLLNLMNNFYSK